MAKVFDPQFLLRYSQQVIAVIRVYDSAGKVIEMHHSVKDQKLDGQRQVDRQRRS